MARTFTLRNSSGTKSVSLIPGSSPGVRIVDNTLGTTYNPNARRNPSASLEDLLFVERWQVVVQGSDLDDANDRVVALIDLLTDAYDYSQREPWSREPVYIIAQSTGETNTRYALVESAPEVTNPDYLSVPVETQFILQHGISIRRFIWSSAAPETLGSAITLDETDGPATPPTSVIVSNFRNTIDLTNGGLIYNEDNDAGPAFSSNFAATAAWDLFEVSGSTPALNDAVYFGLSFAFANVVLTLGTAGVYNVVFTWEYSQGGSAWNALTEGDNLYYYPSTDPLAETGTVTVGWEPPADWATDTVNGQAKYWIRVRISTFTSWTTSPAHATNVPYEQVTPEVRIPDSSLAGDTFPYLAFRARSPAGGDENPEMTTLSRLVVGARSRNLSTFTSHLNLAEFRNPSGWTTTAGTDGTLTATNFNDAPAAFGTAVSFGSSEALVNRCQLHGDAKLAAWEGKYRVFVRCQQVGGNAGEVQVGLTVLIHTNDAYAPKRTLGGSSGVALQGADQGLEIVDLTRDEATGGVLALPFGEIYNADTLTNADIYFQVLASRTSGSSATLRLYDLILIPVDEWSSEYLDPLSDLTNGNSALRGGTLLEDDGGIVANRTQKYIEDGAILVPAETWTRGGPHMMLRPAQDTRLYFLMGHYPSGGSWGTGPLIGTIGMHLVWEMYAQSLYHYLRGDN